ncbi:MAG TPA: DUF2278 family protein [Thermoanaerobaculia bacterium]|nr:DUF2278 family protein [Thermoanaerobaculia bacterium]
MPVPGYGVLIGGVSDRQLATPKKNHYEVRVEAAGQSYRIAVNVQSVDKSEVLYHIDEAFMHPFTTQLAALPDGHHTVPSQAGGIAIDFVRGGLNLHRADFVPLPMTDQGDDNDLNDKIDHYVQRVMSESGARIYAYGSFFKDNKKDPYFGFKPGQGIHDIHFNQGNSGNFAGDNGPWQDGALLFHIPSENRWVAIFLAFQTQSWQVDEHGNPTGVVGPTDDTTTPPPPPPPEISERIRIIAAVANSKGAVEVETVTIVNASPDDINLAGWKLSDRNNNQFVLSGALASGDAIRVKIGPPMQLSNSGGKITLLDGAGKVVDGVSYTKAQASKPGWSIVF